MAKNKPRSQQRSHAFDFDDTKQFISLMHQCLLVPNAKYTFSFISPLFLIHMLSTKHI